MDPVVKRYLIEGLCVFATIAVLGTIIVVAADGTKNTFLTFVLLTAAIYLSAFVVPRLLDKYVWKD